MVEHLTCLKRKRRCVIVLVCTTVGELVVLTSLVIYWRVVRYERMAPQQQEMCLPRNKFHSKGCTDGLSEDFKETKNVTMCCGNSSYVLDKLVSKVASDRYNSNTNPVQIGRNFKLSWNSLSPSYALAGLTHLPDDGTIYVEQTGFYYVFSQIKMKLDQTMTKLNHTMKHYIHLISNKGTGTTLLENARPQCKIVELETEVTSVIGAVFKLETGDRLYVATSHPEHLIPDYNNNYFSIHSV
ncbi:uncharacterized protein LOC123554631 isoform X2 [Mercenaria mercenaria]|uniref:uncharacterized protein LOC123554631 isoform X2 n=1 Tax=Mercenaria mercenaria TaxID=6596 RepID=UPI00234FB2D4|nr:uncharacterized protein LOC123554631 isoform X2 [Mercenaria mercenaria]